MLKCAYSKKETILYIIHSISFENQYSDGCLVKKIKYQNIKYYVSVDIDS